MNIHLLFFSLRNLDVAVLPFVEVVLGANILDVSFLVVLLTSFR